MSSGSSAHHWRKKILDALEGVRGTVGLYSKSFSTLLERKENKFGLIGEGKRNSWTLLTLVIPQGTA